MLSVGPGTLFDVISSVLALLVVQLVLLSLSEVTGWERGSARTHLKQCF